MWPSKISILNVKVNGKLGGDDWRGERENNCGKLRKILERKNRHVLNSLSILTICNICQESGLNALQVIFYSILTMIFLIIISRINRYRDITWLNTTVSKWWRWGMDMVKWRRLHSQLHDTTFLVFLRGKSTSLKDMLY